MITKKHIFLFLASFTLIVAIVGVSVKTTKSVATNAQMNKIKPTIIIDAGHGGEDGGAESPGGLLEKDINLDIALHLQKLFIQSGFDVKMTRCDDNAIYDDDAKTLREKKVSDLHNRTEILNSSQNNILISIHQNKFEQSQYSGTQVFYSKNNPESASLAEYIRVAVKGLLQPNNERECKVATNSIYLLDNATVPAVLVECGFLSNPQEEQLLQSDEYKKCMAFTIYSGFLEYYYLNY
ncbi:MAG: N-acetylmuramoyl-L-alanine amidase [Clostridia bacterium]|nr:N-acetylmuramoyl-L-alanine amidase [Clostridia bacterium]